MFFHYNYNSKLAIDSRWQPVKLNIRDPLSEQEVKKIKKSLLNIKDYIIKGFDTEQFQLLLSKLPYELVGKINVFNKDFCDLLDKNKILTPLLQYKNAFLGTYDKGENLLVDGVIHGSEKALDEWLSYANDFAVEILIFLQKRLKILNLIFNYGLTIEQTLQSAKTEMTKAAQAISGGVASVKLTECSSVVTSFIQLNQNYPKAFLPSLVDFGIKLAVIHSDNNNTLKYLTKLYAGLFDVTKNNFDPELRLISLFGYMIYCHVNMQIAEKKAVFAEIIKIFTTKELTDIAIEKIKSLLRNFLQGGHGLGLISSYGDCANLLRYSWNGISILLEEKKAFSDLLPSISKLICEIDEYEEEQSWLENQPTPPLNPLESADTVQLPAPGSLRCNEALDDHVWKRTAPPAGPDELEELPSKLQRTDNRLTL